MEEIFKDIPNYEGMYQVSNLGNVKSLPRESCNHRGCHILKERILKPSIDIFGYKFVVLCEKNKQKSIKNHQLVAMAFLGHKPCGMKIVVDHINTDRLDNRVENLQLITQRENSSKDRINGTSKYVGVYFQKSSKKWCSHICINGIVTYLGSFNLEEDAKKYYEKALYSLKNNDEIIVKKRIKSSKYKGVSFKKSSNKWISSLRINKKLIYIGSFSTEIEASEAYQNKLKQI
jgi:hypothetical protein